MDSIFEFQNQKVELTDIESVIDEIEEFEENYKDEINNEDSCISEEDKIVNNRYNNYNRKVEFWKSGKERLPLQ